MQIWKQIKDYPNYEVSNLGRIRNKYGYIMSQQSARGGYLQCNLYYKGKKHPLVHKLVFEAFYRKLLPNEIVHHLSEIKTENVSTNLVAWDKKYHLHYHAQNHKDNINGQFI